MFPYQIMDRLLRLKLELAYRDLSIEQARQIFEQIKQLPNITEEHLHIPAPVVKKRKRIPAKK